VVIADFGVANEALALVLLEHEHSSGRLPFDLLVSMRPVLERHTEPLYARGDGL
jgi:hypothetical protein